MGNAEQKKQQLTLIDFLYKDESLINAFYSQIFGGDLQSIVKNELSLDETSSTTGTNNKFFTTLSSTKESTNQGISSSIKPLDDKAIDLLKALNLSLSSIADTNTGSLIAIKCNLVFRNFEQLNNVIPLLESGGLIPDFNKPVNSAAKGKERNFTYGKLVSKMLSLMPHGLEFEAYTTTRERATCILKDDSLSINSNDLLRAYGKSIPGEWTVIGILDKHYTSAIESKNDFKKSVDAMTDVISTLINDTSMSVIRPIAIYRNLI